MCDEPQIMLDEHFPCMLIPLHIPVSYTHLLRSGAQLPCHPDSASECPALSRCQPRHRWWSFRPMSGKAVLRRWRRRLANALPRRTLSHRVDCAPRAWSKSARLPLPALRCPGEIPSDNKKPAQALHMGHRPAFGRTFPGERRPGHAPPLLRRLKWEVQCLSLIHSSLGKMIYHRRQPLSCHFWAGR